MQAMIFSKKARPPKATLQMWITPTPGATELRVRVDSITLNAGDRARMDMGLISKKTPIPGSEFSGTVEATGDRVTRFRLGDEVFGYINSGAHAEYLTIDQDAMVQHKPLSWRHEDAAAVPYGAMAALSFLETANLKAGQSILINGATGVVGQYAVQLAKLAGAEVWGTGGDSSKLAALALAGTLNYRHQSIDALATRFDVIFDVKGNLAFNAVRPMLKPKGRMVTTNFGLGTLLTMVRSVLLPGPAFRTGIAKYTPVRLTRLTGLMESGALRPIRHQAFPIQAVEQAYRHGYQDPAWVAQQP
ncbi:NAD(P)-dependent alcohol dehydrogenase [Reinekea blandensis]|uniref:Alcohol dehydrogenase, zinc-containing n=1 Tax=Reinekea blandensis MED297 TaxID=314283 RepID=A4B9Y9_9GAMM|nr:NAD(P)-dependent alcohol dehydrogenase [Reinekea blandensis]EAR11440.1 alcohol dehydrogenase, zinc-containing [Reinekea sp. MED297] [Reinekea blandensis MED297]